MKIWLDDLRPAPEGFLWLKTSQELLDWMQSRRADGLDLGELISFDHDLGGDDTSRRCVYWMCENGMFPQRVRVHSANPVGADYLRGMIQRYAPAGTLL